MGRKVSVHIASLIKSLTPSEKRYFKLFAQRHVKGEENKYVKLFNAIRRQRNYDEEKLLKDHPFINSRLFPDQKQELYWNVLRSLTGYHAEKSTDSDLRFLLGCFDLLFGKGLYDQCRNMVDRAKRLAKNAERTAVLLECIERERKLEFTNFNLKTSKSRLQAINEEAEELTRTLETDLAYSKLSEAMFMILAEETFIRSAKNKRRSSKIIRSKLLQKYPEERSFHSRYNFLRTHSLYCYSHTDFKGFYRYCKKIAELVERQERMLEENPKAFIVAIQNLLIAQKNLGLFDELFATLKKLKSFETDSREAMGQVFAISNDIEITIYIDTGQFQKGTLLAPGLQKGFEKLRGAYSSRHELLLMFNMAYCFFGNGNYRQSLKWLNKVVYHKEAKTALPVIFNISNVVMLLIHYQLGHTDLLEYRLRALSRTFRKKNELFELEQIIFRFLSRAIITSSRKKLQALKEELHKDMAALHDQPGKLGNFYTFDFLAWSESMATGRSMGDIIRHRPKK